MKGGRGRGRGKGNTDSHPHKEEGNSPVIKTELVVNVIRTVMYQIIKDCFEQLVIWSV